MYPALASLFFISLFLGIGFGVGLLVRPRIWKQHLNKIKIFSILWFLPYFLFIIFLTGPELNEYPPQETSEYKLPWAAGVSRFVAQGNRSFTSHQGTHKYAWDFVMANGTQILAARQGQVVEVKDQDDGIGLRSNFLTIAHSDGQRSVYAHIKKDGALVKIGDHVQQGQPIALSGMVGQTVFPHVHFYVLNSEETVSIPIAFKDVPDGVPLAGRFYTSQNSIKY